MWIHILTPGDHYSPAYGSARITVTHEIVQQHALRGERSLVIAATGTRIDYQSGEVVEVPFRLWLTKRRRAADVLLGRVGLPRINGLRHYAPVLDAIPLDFDGPVFVHNNPVAIPMLARARPRAKICLWAANELFNYYTRRETEAVVRASYRVICVSQFIADDLQKKLGRRDERIRVVGNGVNAEQFSPDPSKRMAPPLILFTGRVVPEKGPDLLLRAAQLLHEKKLNFRVKIVGSHQFDPTDPLSPYEQELRVLAQPLGEIAKFAPAVSRAQVVEEYRAASIFCSPIRWDEPFGLTFLEAMGTGLPVVTAPLGGARQTCGDAGIYFESENVRDLADQLELLVCDETARSQRGIASRQHAQEHIWPRQYELLRAALN